jgi:hypothetical protein
MTKHDVKNYLEKIYKVKLPFCSSKVLCPVRRWWAIIDINPYVFISNSAIYFVGMFYVVDPE